MTDGLVSLCLFLVLGALAIVSTRWTWTIVFDWERRRRAARLKFQTPPRPQFTLRDTLIVVVLAALSLAAARACGDVYWTHGLKCFLGCCVLLIGFLLVTVPLGACVFLFAPGRKRLLFAIVIAVTLVPGILWQALNNLRLDELRAEVPVIQAYLEARRQATGGYPVTLAQYQFQRPRTAGYISYWPSLDDASGVSDFYALDVHSGGGWVVYRAISGRDEWEFLRD